MAETLQEVLTYIDTLLPNGLTSAMKVTLINGEVRKVWMDMTSTNYYNFNTVANQATYTIPSDMEFEMIVENGLMIANSTLAVSSTTVFETYKYCGPEDELNSKQFYDALGLIGIYPVPDNGFPARIRYQERPTIFASTDTAIEFNLDQDYIDLVKFRTMARIAKSGNGPDVELANNYESDARELEARLKMMAAQKRRKISKQRVSYREGWE